MAWRLVALLAVLTGAMVAAAGPAAPGGAPAAQGGSDASTGDASTGDASTGRELYLRDCAGCHGPEADGTFRGPSLRSSGTASVHYMLATGRMPIEDPEEPLQRSAPSYPADAVDAIVAHLDTLIAGPSVPDVDLDGADLSAGAATYRATCAPCHGATGIGGGLTSSSPAPSLLPASGVVTAEAVLTGPGQMPVFRPDVLDDDGLRDVVAYVMYLQDAPTPGGLSLWRVGPVAEGLAMWALGAPVVLLGMYWLGRSR